MSYKIYTKSNYFYIVDNDTDNVFEALSKDVRVRKRVLSSDYFTFDNVKDFSKTISFSEIQTEQGVSYSSISAFIEFYENNTGTISLKPSSTGANGTTPYKLISLATTNANVVKSSGGNLYSIVAIGLTSTVRYLKLYNKATAPTVGTDVPLMTIPVPANTQGAGIAIPFSMGVNFPLGIAIAITSGLADNNTGAILANDVVVNLTYA